MKSELISLGISIIRKIPKENLQKKVKSLSKALQQLINYSPSKNPSYSKQLWDTALLFEHLNPVSPKFTSLFQNTSKIQPIAGDRLFAQKGD